MAVALLKRFLPDYPVPVRVWRGPLRGARVVMNPRSSLRKIFGLYEHELNGWLEAALRRVNRVIDVGANDGYFTFGCAAAFRRHGKPGEIVAFEPQEQHFATLQKSVSALPSGETRVTLVQKFVGGEEASDVATLDSVRWQSGDPNSRTGTLIKIDVEGAEMDVLAGAGSWLKPGLNPPNWFLIEVHKKPFLEAIKELFGRNGLALERVDHRPIRLIGSEVRDEENWWLVSEF